MYLVQLMVSQHALNLTICHYTAQSALVSEVVKLLVRGCSLSIFDLEDLRFLMEIRLVAADITLCSYIFLWPMLNLRTVALRMIHYLGP